MLWELYQQSKIGAADARAESASRKASETSTIVHRLQGRTDRIALTTMAMFALMSERLGITEADLEAKMEEIDLADGKLDGKVRVESNECPSCQRPISKRHKKCMYCGSAINTGLTSL